MEGKLKCPPRTILAINIQRRAKSPYMFPSLGTSFLAPTAASLLSSEGQPLAAGKFYSCKPSPGAHLHGLRSSEHLPWPLDATEFCAVFLRLQTTALTHPHPPTTRTMTTMRRKMSMMTSVALLHPSSPPNLFLTPCPSHTQASGESHSLSHRL